MAPLEQYIQKVYNHKSKHPSQVPTGRIFPDTRSTPQLDDKRTNRIIVYLGSFNPPHRGHLQLLRHAFYHGSHLLNIVGAIIRPSTNRHVIQKCREAGGSFIFGRDERSMLWKQDPCFPDWAWVYEGEDNTFHCFLDQLKEAAGKDDFEIDYVPLRGPTDDDNISPPDLDHFIYGASTMVISDAARVANYQRSNGYMKNFDSYTKWKGLHFASDALKMYVRLKVHRDLKNRYRIDPQEAQDSLEDDVDLEETSSGAQNFLEDDILSEDAPQEARDILGDDVDLEDDPQGAQDILEDDVDMQDAPQEAQDILEDDVDLEDDPQEAQDIAENDTHLKDTPQGAQDIPESDTHLEDTGSLEPRNIETLTAAVDAACAEQGPNSTLEVVRRDIKNIIQCQRNVRGKPYTIRFVKAAGTDTTDCKNYTSSTTLRRAMSYFGSDKYLKTALHEMALSPSILWQCRAQWIEQARARENDLITLDPLGDMITDDSSTKEMSDTRGDENDKVDRIGQIEQASNERSHIQLSQQEAVQESRGNWIVRKRKLSVSKAIPFPAVEEHSHILLSQQEAVQGNRGNWNMRKRKRSVSGDVALPARKNSKVQEGSLEAIEAVIVEVQAENTIAEQTAQQAEIEVR